MEDNIKIEDKTLKDFAQTLSFEFYDFRLSVLAQKIKTEQMIRLKPKMLFY